MKYLPKQYVGIATIALLLFSPLTMLMALDFWQNQTNHYMSRQELITKAHELINEVDENLSRIMLNSEEEYNSADFKQFQTATNNALKKIAHNYEKLAKTFYNNNERDPFYEYKGALNFIKNERVLNKAFNDQDYEDLNNQITGIIFDIKKCRPNKYQPFIQQLLDLLASKNHTQRIISIFILFAVGYFEPSFVEWATRIILYYTDEVDKNGIYTWRPVCDASLYYLYSFVAANDDSPEKQDVLAGILRGYQGYVITDTNDYNAELFTFELPTNNYAVAPKQMCQTDSMIVDGCTEPLTFFSGNQTEPYDSNDGPVISDEIRMVLQLNVLRTKIAFVKKICKEEAQRRQNAQLRKEKAPTLAPLNNKQEINYPGIKNNSETISTSSSTTSLTLSIESDNRSDSPYFLEENLEKAGSSLNKLTLSPDTKSTKQSDSSTISPKPLLQKATPLKLPIVTEEEEEEEEEEEASSQPTVTFYSRLKNTSKGSIAPELPLTIESSSNIIKKPARSSYSPTLQAITEDKQNTIDNESEVASSQPTTFYSRFKNAFKGPSKVHPK